MERTQEVLDFFLDLTARQLKDSNNEQNGRPYSGEFRYEYAMSHLTVNGEVQLTMPTYALRIYYQDVHIISVIYSLDRRFGFELRVDEIHRIETVMANRCMALIGANGAIGLINFVGSSGTSAVSLIREEEEKGFLPLN